MVNENSVATDDDCISEETLEALVLTITTSYLKY